MTDEQQPQQVQAFYSGRVQGVGFRYTTRQIAARYPVTGFVKNLSDGRVQLVAEGACEVLDALLADVAAEFGSHIRRVEEHRSPASGRYAEFRITF